MQHEPRRFVADAQHAVHLMRGHSFFARAHQERRHQPLVERDMAAFEYRADHDGELAAAFLGVALEIAGARLDRCSVVYGPAVPTDRAIRPKVTFEPLAG